MPPPRSVIIPMRASPRCSASPALLSVSIEAFVSVLMYPSFLRVLASDYSQRRYRLAYKISPMYRESLVVPLSQGLLPPSDMYVAAGCTARSTRQDMCPRGGAPWDTVTTRHNG